MIDVTIAFQILANSRWYFIYSMHQLWRCLKIIFFEIIIKYYKCIWTSFAHTLRYATRFLFSCFISWIPISLWARLNVPQCLKEYLPKPLGQNRKYLPVTFVPFPILFLNHTKTPHSSDETAAIASFTIEN